jgi:hypothetical protein
VTAAGPCSRDARQTTSHLTVSCFRRYRCGWGEKVCRWLLLQLGGTLAQKLCCIPSSQRPGSLCGCRTQNRGLGSSTFYDWSTDKRRPLLKGCEADYVTFDGELHLLLCRLFTSAKVDVYLSFSTCGLQLTTAWRIKGHVNLCGVQEQLCTIAKRGS